MLSATTSKRLNAIGEISSKGKKVNGLFRLMENPALWEQAYVNIYSNKGAMTRGVDKATLDGFSDERAVSIIKLLKDGRYRFKPSRRVYIPKANGKMRPLGIPSADDKLVQEVMRIILERIYEPIFKSSSHGFRPGRSCHTALGSVRRTWTGIKWIIDMDIQGFFDNIDHQIMIKLLEKRIADKRFIRLIKAMLEAGYVEDWKAHKTYSGTPQGGIISPLLANIYLHELDEFMETLTSEFNKGKRRQDNPEYKHYSWVIYRLRKEHDRIKSEGNELRLKVIRKEIRRYDQIRKKLPAFNPSDANYRRLTYCRYADDFLIGVIGSREESAQVMNTVKEFIRTELNLNVSEEKSGIRHSSEKTRFLGYNLAMYQGERLVKTKHAGRHTTVRSIAEKIELSIPDERLLKFCHSKGYGNYDLFQMIHRPELLNLSDAEILTIYNAEFRGLANYYILATSAKKSLDKLHGMWIGSLLKTLAGKHQTSVSKIARKLRESPGEYVLTDKHNGRVRTVRLFRLKDLEDYPRSYATVDAVPNTPRLRIVYSELLKRVQSRSCEYCGRTGGYFEVHQIGQMKSILNGFEPWQQLMIKRRRKTLILCIECHQLLHEGKLPAWKRAR
jgi:RNA-directed DNA polymerase